MLYTSCNIHNTSKLNDFGFGGKIYMPINHNMKISPQYNITLTCSKFPSSERCFSTFLYSCSSPRFTSFPGYSLKKYTLISTTIITFILGLHLTVDGGTDEMRS